MILLTDFNWNDFAKLANDLAVNCEQTKNSKVNRFN